MGTRHDTMPSLPTLLRTHLPSPSPSHRPTTHARIPTKTTLWPDEPHPTQSRQLLACRQLHNHPLRADRLSNPTRRRATTPLPINHARSQIHNAPRAEAQLHHTRQNRPKQRRWPIQRLVCRLRRARAPHIHLRHQRLPTPPPLQQTEIPLCKNRTHQRDPTPPPNNPQISRDVARNVSLISHFGTACLQDVARSVSTEA